MLFGTGSDVLNAFRPPPGACCNLGDGGPHAEFYSVWDSSASCRGLSRTSSAEPWDREVLRTSVGGRCYRNRVQVSGNQNHELDGAGRPGEEAEEGGEEEEVRANAGSLCVLAGDR